MVTLNLSPEKQSQAEISVILSQRKSNGYQESSLVQFKKVNYCNFIDQTWVRHSVEHFYSHTNFSETKCPFTPGTYFIKDFYPDLSNPPVIPNGQYRMDIHFIYDNVIINGAQAVFIVEF
ncbi:uncharacterized protein LOC123295524 [Chrysoperla carnea]|uniref:uncharacterized protein LOC123295524 n=1 Tax=Chrysoperla carnea TaxID=189513 RepID=UPI001D07C9FB|nr:uncharacterized protein LOC123295524 [Chrysoperla carnea]